MNRPTNAPCWVVFTYVGGQDGSKGSRFYMANPNAADQLRQHGEGKVYKNYDGCFSAYLVEPFLSEVDAIAAALLVDGHVDKYEAGEQWPVSMKRRYNRISSAKDNFR